MTHDQRRAGRLSRGGRPGITRRYRQRARADQQAATRRRIAEAAMQLHGSIGPARTTISAIAERAGVERLTVYRHYPDEAALFAACSSHFLRENPPPDLAGPLQLSRPEDRVSAVLLALYRYYRRTEPMLSALTRDAPVVPLVAQYLEPYRALLRQLTRHLAGGFDDASDRRTLRASIGHALAFGTWGSLAMEQGLSDRRAVALMTRLVLDTARLPAGGLRCRGGAADG